MNVCNPPHTQKMKTILRKQKLCFELEEPRIHQMSLISLDLLVASIVQWPPISMHNPLHCHSLCCSSGRCFNLYSKRRIVTSTNTRHPKTQQALQHNCLISRSEKCTHFSQL